MYKGAQRADGDTLPLPLDARGYVATQGCQHRNNTANTRKLHARCKNSLQDILGPSLPPTRRHCMSDKSVSPY
jgi:hypothetical protein